MAECTIVHEHFRAMNAIEVEHLLFQDLQVDVNIYFLRETTDRSFLSL